MRLEISADRGLAFFLVSLMIVLILLGMAGAYNDPPGAGNPAVMGHSIDELNLSPIYVDIANGNVGIGTTGPGTVNAIALGGLSTHLKGSGITRYIVEGTQPELFMWDSDAGVNAKGVLQFIDGGTFRIDRLTDAMSNSVALAINSNGNVGIGTTEPYSSLQVGARNSGIEYFQIDTHTSAPPASDCDHWSERGRMVYFEDQNRIYFCSATGWRFIVPQT